MITLANIAALLDQMEREDLLADPDGPGGYLYTREIRRLLGLPTRETT